MQILLSALSCHSGVGSEALVGYRYAEALSRVHSVTLVAAPPTEVPPGVTYHPVEAGPCDFNDVAAGALARFEAGQMVKVWRLHRQNNFEVIHRVTPSWIGNASVLPALRVPFVIGPLLAADPPPTAFDGVASRAVEPPRGGRYRPRRWVDSLAWRLRDGLTKRNVHLRSARKILVGTRLALDRVPAAFQSRCELIPYAGVEHHRFVPPASREPRDGPLRLLYVGRLVPYKGLELLLRAVAVASRHIDVRLRVVGKGAPAFEGFCRQLVADRGVSHLVAFEASVPRMELPGIYREADVFCFPTLCDTYGVALLEAMSSGCAVVVTDVAGPREIVTPGTGIKVSLFEPEQYVNDFADALVHLAANPPARDALGQAARARMIEHHDWGKIAHQLIDLYRRI